MKADLDMVILNLLTERDAYGEKGLLRVRHMATHSRSSQPERIPDTYGSSAVDLKKHCQLLSEASTR